MNTSKLLLSLGLGAAFWLLAALLVRFVGPVVLAEVSFRTLLLLAATVPLTRTFIQTARRLGRLSPPEVYDSVVVMTTIATLLDGLAIMFYPALYGSSPRLVMLGAAWILWGVGCGLLLAYRIKASHQTKVAGPAEQLARVA